MKTIKELAKAIIFEHESGIATAFSRAFALVQDLANTPEPEPVAYQVRNGWVNVAIYQRQIDAENYAKDQQKRHDLSGSLASFCVVPLYTAPPAPSVQDGWKHDCAGIMQNDVELWLDSCPHCGKPKTDAAPTPAESPADVARDAERWRMLPAFLEEFEISYLRLEDAIDAAIAAEKGGA